MSDAYAAQLPEKIKQIEAVWHELPQQNRRSNRTHNAPATEWDWDATGNHAISLWGF